MRRSMQQPLQPRRTPIQARSAATLQAIHEAAVQLLLREGSDRLTTIRVAERAGVSVGTLYQYYPNKQALLYAVLELHLMALLTSVEQACKSARGEPVPEMVRAVVHAFLDAKLEKPELAAALERMNIELDGVALSVTVRRRLRAAVQDLFATAEELHGVSLSTPVFLLMASLAGATRAALEAGAPRSLSKALREQLTVLGESYLTSGRLA